MASDRLRDISKQYAVTILDQIEESFRVRKRCGMFGSGYRDILLPVSVTGSLTEPVSREKSRMVLVGFCSIGFGNPQKVKPKLRGSS
ncbi:hypothetical protein RRG08_033495 [Elysia crispata]|uniref:Uncharacterized protein n=1 Tax=Elysia crispata TaxID=231223 RepID=A0AAE1E4B4_9GAST|nr:hypothetical protein RRG08_033495 [Elysia crispata]